MCDSLVLKFFFIKNKQKRLKCVKNTLNFLECHFLLNCNKVHSTSCHVNFIQIPTQEVSCFSCSSELIEFLISVVSFINWKLMRCTVLLFKLFQDIIKCKMLYSTTLTNTRIISELTPWLSSALVRNLNLKLFLFKC